MPSIAGQDGTLYDLTPEQADQYYKIEDFQEQQKFLKGAGTGTTPVLPPVASPPVPAALAGAGVATPSNDLAVSPDLYGSLFGPSPIPNALGEHTSHATLAASDPERALDLIERYESGGRNIPNYRFDQGHTAQGNFQITDTTWRGAAPRAGVDIGQYPNAMSAPYEVQRAVAKELLMEQGFAPWAPYNPSLAAAIGWQGSGQASASGNALAAQIGPQPTAPAPQTANAGTPTALAGMGAGGSPWNRMLALSLLAHGAQTPAIQVKYDPSRAMISSPLALPSAEPALTGALPGSSQVPVSRFRAAPVASGFTPVEAPGTGSRARSGPGYVTRIGMRDFWESQT